MVGLDSIHTKKKQVKGEGGQKGKASEDIATPMRVEQLVDVFSAVQSFEDKAG